MSGLVTLVSAEGQGLLADVRNRKWPYQPIIYGIFAKQRGKSNCGVQSSALVISAAKLGQTEGYEKASYTENDAPMKEMDMFNFAETTNVKAQDKIDCDGLTLGEVHQILLNHDVDVVKVNTGQSDVADFRNRARDALRKANSSASIIVNYHMSTLGQNMPYGHHSPLGAYHEDSDRFLILDTWFQTEVCWAKAEDLFRAMDTTDPASNQKRGFLIVGQ